VLFGVVPGNYALLLTRPKCPLLRVRWFCCGNGLPIADPPIAERTQPSPIDLPPCGFSRSGYCRRLGFLLRQAEASAVLCEGQKATVLTLPTQPKASAEAQVQQRAPPTSADIRASQADPSRRGRWRRRLHKKISNRADEISTRVGFAVQKPLKTGHLPSIGRLQRQAEPPDSEPAVNGWR
jgi:hypothetical protein